MTVRQKMSPYIHLVGIIVFFPVPGIGLFCLTGVISWYVAIPVMAFLIVLSLFIIKQCSPDYLKRIMEIEA